MAIALVQSATAAGTSLTLSSATTAGNCLIVGFTDEGGASSVSAVKLGGAAGNFAQLVSAAGAPGKAGEVLAVLWADPNCAGGQTAVAVTAPGATHPTLWAAEFSGIVSASPLDKQAGTTGTAGTWSSGNTATTTQATELWVGAACLGSAGSTGTGPSSPWTNVTVNDSSGDTMFYGYNIVSSTGAAVYTGSMSGTGGWAAAVATLKGAASASVSGTVQPRATVQVPRRRPARAAWQRITGQAFVQVPAPAQEYRTPPRRRSLRALVRFTPVSTTNALPPPPPSGTVQPEAAQPAARRKPARGIARGLAVPGIRGTAPAQEYRTPPRRRLSRALVRFTPVKTTNAPRNLLVSIASQAGTDDYGTAYPQGILATAGEIEGPTLVGSNAFFYSSKTLGGLTQSVTEASGTDAYGNAYIAGTATYANNGSFWSAVVVDSGVVTWYMATGPGGPWTSEAGIGFNFNALTGGGLQFTGPAGNGMTGDLNVTGSITVTATLTVNGTDVGATLSAIRAALSGASTSTNGLPNGTITGTSGAASAGTAHTHGGGSYSVTNGQHSHTLPTF